MAINKVIFGDDTLMDITDSTVTPSSLVEGVVAYSRSGERITGEAVIPTKYSQLEDDIGYVLSTDSRLSNARTPTAHTHTATEVSYGANLSYTVKKNVYINTNGAELSYSGWDDTDYIDISGHSRIYCNINNQWNCWYKADKTFLSQANFSNKTYLDVPSGAKYLRVSGTASAINSLSVSTSAETVASILDTKADKNEIPDVSNFVLNNDSRLTDSRTPTAHTHTKSQITDFPAIPTVPTNVSAFNNDAGYLTSLGDPYTETDIDNMWQYANLYYWEDSNTSGGDIPVIGGGDDGPIIIEPLL